MSGGKSQTSTQSTQIPADVLARYNSVNADAQNVAQTPFTPYSQSPSDFVAPLSSTQQAGIYNTNAAAGEAQPYFGAGALATAAGAGAVNPTTLDANAIQQYESPYISNVLGATTAIQGQQNAQQLQGLKGGAIKAGAFGGDRAGIGAANLAFQQNLANSKTNADILNQGYQFGANTAQQQQGVNLGAGQANQARLLAAGQQIAGLGAGAQGAALQGAQAQLAAGQQQQQTDQAGRSALYNQFLQEQGYPFQVAQFLANIAEGTGSLSGSTTTTTQPAPFFSDERLKEDIQTIGETYDGQKIIKFRYKGSPQVQVGLSAQNVEKHHPDAVGLAAGFKTVDYDRATQDSAKRGHFGLGGATSAGNHVIPFPMRRGYDAGGMPTASGKGPETSGPSSSAMALPEGLALNDNGAAVPTNQAGPDWTPPSHPAPPPVVSPSSNPGGVNGLTSAQQALIKSLSGSGLSQAQIDSLASTMASYGHSVGTSGLAGSSASSTTPSTLTPAGVSSTFAIPAIPTYDFSQFSTPSAGLTPSGWNTSAATGLAGAATTNDATATGLGGLTGGGIDGQGGPSPFTYAAGGFAEGGAPQFDIFGRPYGSASRIPASTAEMNAQSAANASKTFHDRLPGKAPDAQKSALSQLASVDTQGRQLLSTGKDLYSAGKSGLGALSDWANKPGDPMQLSGATPPDMRRGGYASGGDIDPYDPNNADGSMNIPNQTPKYQLPKSSSSGSSNSNQPSSLSNLKDAVSLGSTAVKAGSVISEDILPYLATLFLKNGGRAGYEGGGAAYDPTDDLAQGDADTSDIPVSRNTYVAKTADGKSVIVDGTTGEAVGSGLAGARAPRSVRNNNPGNIEDGPFARKMPGYAGGDGRFARFETPDHGASAMDRLLSSYGSRGLDTPAAIIGRWSPQGDNAPGSTSNYVATVAKALGVAPDEKIDMSDPKVRATLRNAMTNVEAGPPGSRAIASSAPRGGLAAAGNDNSAPAERGSPPSILGGLGSAFDNISNKAKENQSWLIPLMQGLGAMASSNSRYLGAAALQGLGAAGTGYANLQKQHAEYGEPGQTGIPQQRVNIEAQRNAIESAKYMTQAYTRFIDPIDNQVKWRGPNGVLSDAEHAALLSKVAGSPLMSSGVNVGSVLTGNEQKPSAGLAAGQKTDVVPKSSPIVSTPLLPTPQNAPPSLVAESAKPSAPQAGIDDSKIASNMERPSYLIPRINQLIAARREAISNGVDPASIDKELSDNQTMLKEVTSGNYTPLTTDKSPFTSYKDAANQRTAQTASVTGKSGLNLEAWKAAQADAEASSDIKSQTALLLDTAFDPKTGKSVVSTGPVGPAINHIAGIAKQLGGDPAIIQSLLRTDPSNAQEIEKLTVQLGAQIGRQALGSGSRETQGEFMQFLKAVPSIGISSDAIKKIANEAILPKVQQSQEVWNHVKGMNPSTDNIQQEITDYKIQHPWYTSKEQPTGVNITPEAARAELQRRRALKQGTP